MALVIFSRTPAYLLPVEVDGMLFLVRIMNGLNYQKAVHYMNCPEDEELVLKQKQETCVCAKKAGPLHHLYLLHIQASTFLRMKQQKMHPHSRFFVTLQLDG